MTQRPIDVARERAYAAGAAPDLTVPADGRTRTRRLAIGDPQAPLETFLGVLDAHRALGSDGRLAPEVALVSMGDHFDYGKRDQREKATADGTAILAWLAAHPPDQVTILLGNHDLGRVGELVRFDDRSFGVARSEADVIYGEGKAKPEGPLEMRFRELHPDLPSTEMASRDFSTFAVAQRQLVAALLRAKRFRIAIAASPHLLLCHAGVTDAELDALGVSTLARGDALLVANALNAALDAEVAVWDGESPLSLGVLHQPGSGATGEGRGMFYHRPSDPAYEPAAGFAGPPARRFDPRKLPRGLVQAIGHIRDGKCRALLPDWHDGAATLDGPLRHLVTDGTNVKYARGIPSRWEKGHAGMIFLDGGMSHVEPTTYELLDLTTGQPAAHGGSV